MKTPALEIVPLTPDLHEVWDDIVRRSPDAWLYHWYDEQLLLEEAWGVETYSFMVSKHGTPVAIVPLQRHRENAYLDSTAMGPAGPALIPDLEDGEACEILVTTYGHIKRTLEASRGRGISGGHIFLPSLSQRQLESYRSGRNPLIEFNLKDISTQTAIIDLAEKTPDKLFQELRENHRRDIKRSLKEEVIVVPAVCAADVDEYYRLHVDTYRRTGVPPHPIEYFRRIWKYFGSTGRSEMLFAIHHGEPVAAMNVALFRDTALYWTGANSSAGLRLGAGKRLMWEAILRAHASGRRWFEVGEVFDHPATGSKHAGLTQHKSGYGGEIHPFHKGVMEG